MRLSLLATTAYLAFQAAALATHKEASSRAAPARRMMTDISAGELVSGLLLDQQGEDGDEEDSAEQLAKEYTDCLGTAPLVLSRWWCARRLEAESRGQCTRVASAAEKRSAKTRRETTGVPKDQKNGFCNDNGRCVIATQYQMGMISMDCDRPIKCPFCAKHAEGTSCKYEKKVCQQGDYPNRPPTQ